METFSEYSLVQEFKLFKTREFCGVRDSMENVSFSDISGGQIIQQGRWWVKRKMNQLATALSYNADGKHSLPSVDNKMISCLHSYVIK